MIDLIICLHFEIILELENVKQDDVKAETKENTQNKWCPFGTQDCFDGGNCILNQYICDGACDCRNCADEPAGGAHCGWKDGEVKENQRTIPKIPVN